MSGYRFNTQNDQYLMTFVNHPIAKAIFIYLIKTSFVVSLKDPYGLHRSTLYMFNNKSFHIMINNNQLDNVLCQCCLNNKLYHLLHFENYYLTLYLVSSLSSLLLEICNSSFSTLIE